MFILYYHNFLIIPLRLLKISTALSVGHFDYLYAHIYQPLTIKKTLHNCAKIEQKRHFDSLLTHALHVQYVIDRVQPIGLKQKRTLVLYPGHRLSSDTNCVWLNSLVN